MTETTLLNQLDGLHDWLLLAVTYGLDSAGQRIVRLRLQEDSAASPPKECTLVAHDVLLFQLRAWGHATAPETLDAWYEQVAPEMAEELARFAAAGIDIPPVALTATFHSGSWLQLVCRTLVFES